MAVPAMAEVSGTFDMSLYASGFEPSVTQVAQTGLYAGPVSFNGTMVIQGGTIGGQVAGTAYQYVDSYRGGALVVDQISANVNHGSVQAGSYSDLSLPGVYSYNAVTGEISGNGSFNGTSITQVNFGGGH